MEEILEDRLRELDYEAGISDSLSNVLSGSQDFGDSQGENPRTGAAAAAAHKEGATSQDDSEEEEEGGGGGGGGGGVGAAADLGDDPEWIDVLGSGQLWKKVIKPGTGPRPERGQRATICYTGTYDGVEFDRKEEFSFVLGDNEAIFGETFLWNPAVVRTGNDLTFHS